MFLEPKAVSPLPTPVVEVARTCADRLLSGSRRVRLSDRNRRVAASPLPTPFQTFELQMRYSKSSQWRNMKAMPMNGHAIRAAEISSIESLSLE